MQASSFAWISSMLIFDYFVSQKTPMTTNYTIQFIRGKLALDHTTNLSLVHLSTILQMKNRYERMIIVYLNSYEHMTYSSRHTAGGGSGGNRPGQQLVNRPQQHRNQILDISEFEKKKKNSKITQKNRKTWYLFWMLYRQGKRNVHYHDNSRLEGPGGMPAAGGGASRGGGGSIFLCSDRRGIKVVLE